MNDTTTFPAVTPSATPSDAKIFAWQALPRDEQLRRLRLELSHPDCSTVSDATMEEIRVRGQGAAAKFRNG